MSVAGRAEPTLLAGGGDNTLTARLRQAWMLLEPDGRLLRAHAPSELVGLATRLQPEFVALSEPWLRNAGLDLLTQLAANSTPSIIVLGDSLGAVTVVHSFSAGFRGMLAADADVETIRKAISTIRSGEMWISRRVLLEALHCLAPPAAKHDTWGRLPSLSEREQAVLREMLAGHPNKEIAEKLAISESTVKAHVQHLYLKLGVHRRIDLLRATLAPRSG